jgi:hypothetical protein
MLCRGTSLPYLRYSTACGCNGFHGLDSTSFALLLGDHHDGRHGARQTQSLFEQIWGFFLSCTKNWETERIGTILGTQEAGKSEA